MRRMLCLLALLLLACSTWGKVPTTPGSRPASKSLSEKLIDILDLYEQATEGISASLETSKQRLDSFDQTLNTLEAGLTNSGQQIDSLEKSLENYRTVSDAAREAMLATIARLKVAGVIGLVVAGVLIVTLTVLSLL